MSVPMPENWILPWVMAIEQDMKLSKLASMLVPYPRLSEIGKRVAGSFYTPRLFNARTRMLVRWLARLDDPGRETFPCPVTGPPGNDGSFSWRS
ncbi:MAG: hypothetical protein R3D03_13370 [Geminicoccaceae bacterium]